MILSGVMLLQHLGWTEAADLILSSLEATIKAKVVTYDFARLMEGATEVSRSAFGSALIEHMQPGKAAYPVLALRAAWSARARDHYFSATHATSIDDRGGA